MSGRLVNEGEKLKRSLCSPLGLERILFLLSEEGFRVTIYQLEKNLYSCSMQNEVEITNGSYKGQTARDAVIEAYANVINKNDKIAKYRKDMEYLNSIRARSGAGIVDTKEARYQAAQKRELGKIVLADL